MDDIQRSFETYYKNLFAQPQVNFLSSLDLLSIETEQNKRMTQEITEEEINKAILRLKTSKMPGADVIHRNGIKPLESPNIERCFNYVLKSRETSLSWSQAIISFIPKPG